MRRPDGKYLLGGLAAAVVFNIILQLFYNLLRHDTLLPYASV